MLISAGLGFVNLSLIQGIFVSGITLFTGIFTILFVVGVALLIRKGFGWIKYFLTALIALGLFSTVTFIIDAFQQYPIASVLTILQTMLQLWALVLLFMVPSESAD